MDSTIPSPEKQQPDMEVHHHPDLHHERKKFKVYLLEFLMIFLAVTLGFFAESFREHISEKNTERQYMKEIVENLKYDTIRCAGNAEMNEELIRGMDSLRGEIKLAISGNINSNALYYYSLMYGGKYAIAAFNTSAIKEFKNSGSLRLVESKKLMDEITEYYERKMINADLNKPQGDQVEILQNQLFSLLNLDEYVNSFGNRPMDNYVTNYNYRDLLQHKPMLQLLKNDPAEMEKLYNEETRFEMGLKSYNIWLYACKKAATQLIGDIIQEYQFK